MQSFKEKQAWILSMQNRIVPNTDKKSQTSEFLITKENKTHHPKQKPHLLPIEKPIKNDSKNLKSDSFPADKKPVSLIKNAAILQSDYSKSSTFPDKLLLKKENYNNIVVKNESIIPELEIKEWEFDNEEENEVWDMMDGFDEKINKKKDEMSDLEKMELEHNKLKNMTERIKKYN